MIRIIRESRYILLYGGIMAVLVFVLKWLQWRYIITDYSLDIYIGLIALLFTALGTWGALQLTKGKVKTVLVEKQVLVTLPQGEVNNEELQKLNLSSREHEVLQWLARGLTNAEIADKLCLSLSTVKTHMSNLFVKMDVKNRTQALEKANRLRITAP